MAIETLQNELSALQKEVLELHLAGKAVPETLNVILKLTHVVGQLADVIQNFTDVRQAEAIIHKQVS